MKQTEILWHGFC